MAIKKVNLATKLDFLPDGDIDEHEHAAEIIKENGAFNYFTIERQAPKSPAKSPTRSPGKSPGKGSPSRKSEKESQGAAGVGEALKEFRGYLAKAEQSRRVELLQNGSHVYFWTTTTQQRTGKGFSSPGTTVFDLVEYDLGTGVMETLDKFRIKANDTDGWIPVAASFTRRHSRKEYAFAGWALPREVFHDRLKKDVVCVREVKLSGAAPAMRITLRNMANFEEILYTLFEGPLDHKLHFITQINSEDLLRLQDQTIINKHLVKSYERQAEQVGILYLTEDSMSNGFYNVVEVQRGSNGSVSGCTKLKGLAVSAPRLETFKHRVIGCNFKYLYNEERRQFFMRKAVPICPGTIAICDVILNKMIFLEVDGDRCRLRVTHLKNHGLSFQKLTAQQLSCHLPYPVLKAECLTLSNLLAANMANLDSKLKQ